MQSLEYEINTLFTSNGQTPSPRLALVLEPIASNGKSKGDSGNQNQGTRIEHRTAIFPKLIFHLEAGLNLEPGTPNYDIKQVGLGMCNEAHVPRRFVIWQDCRVDRLLPGTHGMSLFPSRLEGWEWCRSQFWPDESGVVTVNLPRIALSRRQGKVLANL